MKRWIGAAAFCVNEHGKVLMVLQGKPEEKKVWALPSGGIEPGETLEMCCIREVREETGYDVEIVKKLHVKVGQSYGYDVEVHYFECKVVGGSPCIQDPDGLIHDIAWKTFSDIMSLDLSFPEDKAFILDRLQSKRFSNRGVPS
jgi:ADP-ribose pyrophosphatase YjhB (NUDIX family)